MYSFQSSTLHFLLCTVLKSQAQNIPVYSHLCLNTNMTAFVKVTLAALLVVHLVSLVSASKNHLHKRARRQGDQRPAYTQQGCLTACQKRGYSQGCCDITKSTCFNSGCSCYCDISCHNYGDCCADINAIGCSIIGQGSCPEIPLTNGRIDYTPNPNSRQIGTIATIHCDGNYGLVPADATVRVCQKNLMWSGPEPACRELCDEIGILKNGIITYEQAFKTSRKPARTVAIYSCHQGFSLTHAREVKRVCQGFKGWSGSPPTCEAVSCMAKYPGTGCTTDINASLLGSSGNPGRCSCHVSCFSNTDTCCEDIGCVPTTCGQVDMSNGCCSWDTDLELGVEHKLISCYVPGGDCYCDSACNNVTPDDCCSDVPESPTCTAPATRQSRVRGQSVRTIPYGRVQLARGRGRTQASMKDQAARNMASKLMSMSQEQSDKRDRWVVITKELEAMQKKKY